MSDPQQSPYFKPRLYGNRYMRNAAGRPIEHVGYIKAPDKHSFVLLDLLTDQWIVTVTANVEEMWPITEMEVLALVSKDSDG